MIARSGCRVAGLPIFLSLLAWPSPARSDPVAANEEPFIETAGRVAKGSGSARSTAGEFQFTATQKAEIDKVARMILNGEPESRVRQQWLTYWKKHGAQIHVEWIASARHSYKREYDSQTRGADAAADEISVKVMKRQVEKEMWASERSKAEQMLDEAQREHVEKMMEMIEEMTKELVTRID